MQGRHAIIDLGTNTFHLLVIEKSESSYQILHTEKKVVMIGENGITNSSINASALSRALEAAKSFKCISEEYNVSSFHVTATSAVREANNGYLFTKEIQKATGFDIKVITGDKEAELIYYGVRSALKLGDFPSLIMDIGGGSVEFIIGNSTKILWKQSIPIGAQRLIEKFHHNDPINTKEIAEIENYLKSNLQSLIAKLEEIGPKTLIGASGSFDTLSDIYKLKFEIEDKSTNGEVPFDLDCFYGIYHEILSKDREQRLNMPGMIEMRVDMIVVACILINYVLKNHKFNDIRVSSYGLKEGILFCLLNGLSYY